MSFCVLPNDLILCIADYLLEEQDINALVQTNRHLYQLLNGYLYKCNIRYSNCSALDWAACTGQDLTIRRAIGAGARINQFFGLIRKTPLLLAAQNGHLSTVALLLANGADCWLQDYRGYTPMQWAIETNHVPLTRLLIAEGMNPNDMCNNLNYRGGTALYVASLMGHLEIMELLLGLGLDVNAQDESGHTPLHWTVFWMDHCLSGFGRGRQWSVENMLESAMLLFNHGADL